MILFICFMLLIPFKGSVSLFIWKDSWDSYLIPKAVTLIKKRKFWVLTIIGQLVNCAGFSEGVEKQLSDEPGCDLNSCYATTTLQL